MLKGQELDLDIESMTHGSYAIARHEGMPIFADNLCPGDNAKLSVYDQRKDFAFAHVLEIDKLSEFRNPEPKCKLHKTCGGCQWQHIDYQKQLEYKRKNIIDLFIKEKILDKDWREADKQDLEKIPMAIGMDEGAWNYRNKITYPVATKDTGRLVAGYYKKNTHDLINIKHCPIQYEVFDEIMAEIKELCSKHLVTKPPLRHIGLRANRDKSQILVTFVTRTREFNQKSTKAEKNSDKKKFLVVKSKLTRIAKLLSEKFTAIKGVALNYNDMSTNVIFGHKTETVYGEAFIVDELNSLKFRVSPVSFFQVNSIQADKLVSTVKDFVSLADGDKVLDAYSGTGTLALSLAKDNALKITAIEVIESAVEDAKENAKLNQIENVDFILAKLEDHVDKFKSGDFDLITVNPPRKGCTNKVLEALARIEAPNIVYVSCNPATLARDIKYLEDYGYKLKKLQPIDLFPHTYHIESVALLTR